MLHPTRFYNRELIFNVFIFRADACLPMQKEFSSALTHAPPSLRSFTLTKVHKSCDDDLTRCAARIVSENPGLKNFTLRVTQGSWFSYNESGGRVRGLGVYDVATDVEDFHAEEGGLAFDGDVDSLPQWESPPPSPPSSSSSPSQSWGARRSIDALSSADTTAGYHNSASIATSSTIPIPTAMVVHEWCQKSGLMGKELARHGVVKLTEKEMEMCRAQMKDLVRRKRAAVSLMMSRSFSMSSAVVSRRSSSASSMAPWHVQGGYAFAVGRKNGPLVPLRQGRGHKHSSSMSSVGRAANGMVDYGFGGCASGYGSVSWADQYRSIRMKDDHFSRSRKPALTEEGYVVF